MPIGLFRTGKNVLRSLKMVVKGPWSLSCFVFRIFLNFHIIERSADPIFRNFPFIPQGTGCTSILQNLTRSYNGVVYQES